MLMLCSFWIEMRDEFYQYLFYTSARNIKALEEPKFRELRQILDSDETPEKLVNEF